MLFLYLRNVAGGLRRGDTYHLALEASSGGRGAPRHEPHGQIQLSANRSLSFFRVLIEFPLLSV